MDGTRLDTRLQWEDIDKETETRKTNARLCSIPWAVHMKLKVLTARISDSKNKWVWHLIPLIMTWSMLQQLTTDKI